MLCLMEVPGRPAFFLRRGRGAGSGERGGREEKQGGVGLMEEGNYSWDKIYERRMKNV